ncbi:MAG TPA: tRNA (N6-isopentenyl adenosine(37)-C2)-methylthiotransferase MiaB [bacterium]|nr:tRNA (N6-isopentenyl adenosine(37)-C2)-methylthiotransferase MiaB [bacterium]HOM25971.1 tRNA (N6-isopentenyl adenosine(37)-C2)-methylthiotransferase MiaB [bacterium]
MSKKFFIKTYGCQMNFYDSERLRALLKRENFIEVSIPEEADYIIVNTCSVRKHAEDRAISFLSSLKNFKNNKKFCLVGCTPSLYREEIFKRYDFVDIICGPNSYKKFVEVLKNNFYDKKIGIFQEDMDLFNEILLPEIRGSSVSSFISITKGCENFCSYCVVPYTRGKLISKPVGIILEEIKKLVEKGIKEVILLGQNVNEYGKDNGENFVELLTKVHNIDGLLKIGFLTSHPKDISTDLINLFSELPKLYKHLHLPLQSGSNKILKLMNRKYSLEKYIEIVQRARNACPDISITSDIILGFPYEDEKDFEQTYRVIEEIEFDDLYVFKYSPRPLTEANKFPDNVPKEEKEKRHRLILNLQDKISLLKNKKKEGKIDDVFIKKESYKKKNSYIGRTTNNKPVIVETEEKKLEGKIFKVKIEKGERHYLYGSIVRV